jgi:hypothetical protein
VIIPYSTATSPHKMAIIDKDINCPFPVFLC